MPFHSTNYKKYTLISSEIRKKSGNRLLISKFIKMINLFFHSFLRLFVAFPLSLSEDLFDMVLILDSTSGVANKFVIRMCNDRPDLSLDIWQDLLVRPFCNTTLMSLTLKSLPKFLTEA